jgi:hypothetical protein
MPRRRILVIVSIPALPYLFMTFGLWGFPGCPPESLDYPGHPAPRVPLAATLWIIGFIWAWFILWCGASLLLNHLLHARSRPWVRMSSWVVPLILTLTTPIPCVLLVTLATLC